MVRRTSDESDDNLRQNSQVSSIACAIMGFEEEECDVLAQASKAARCTANVLLLGESGTGKELFAHAIHAKSARASHPFVPVDCAALPENLLEAELFGYEKGAFTGAAREKPGLMEVANHGTLFFDEIGELLPALQPKLLRALQERQHRRVGGVDFIAFDIRVICATNRDLRRLVADGRFREDLFYRLHVITIHLPPLRQRPSDIVLLAQHFLNKYGPTRNPPVRAIDPRALFAMKQYPWPGNVRQLQNAIEYACAVCERDLIVVEDLPPDIRKEGNHTNQSAHGSFPDFRTAKAQFEAQYLTELLSQYRGNVSAAAQAAGIDRKTIYNLMKRCGMGHKDVLLAS